MAMIDALISSYGLRTLVQCTKLNIWRACLEGRMVGAYKQKTSLKKQKLAEPGLEEDAMDGTHRVLVAARPTVWREIQAMLDGTVDLVPVHTPHDALRILERERINLILVTVAFDESRMVEFVQAVKAHPAAGAIPLLCARVVPSLMRDSLIGATRDACKACGAVDLVDVATLPADNAKAALRAAVEACLH